MVSDVLYSRLASTRQEAGPQSRERHGVVKKSAIVESMAQHNPRKAFYPPEERPADKSRSRTITPNQIVQKHTGQHHHEHPTPASPLRRAEHNPLPHGYAEAGIQEWWEREGKSDVKIYATSLAIALVVRSVALEPRFIPSLSMFPTFEIGDQLAVDKLSNKLSRPYQRKDVVVFYPPPKFSEFSNRGKDDVSVSVSFFRAGGEKKAVEETAAWNSDPALPLAMHIAPNPRPKTHLHTLSSHFVAAVVCTSSKDALSAF